MFDFSAGCTVGVWGVEVHRKSLQSITALGLGDKRFETASTQTNRSWRLDRIARWQ